MVAALKLRSLSQVCKGKFMQCFLTCVYGSHPDVFLPNGKAVVIGRMPELKLVDPLCSRSQLQLTANYNCKYVLVKRLGRNSSQIDGIEISKETSSKLLPDQNLFIVNMKYPHKVFFTGSDDRFAAQDDLDEKGGMLCSGHHGLESKQNIYSSCTFKRSSDNQLKTCPSKSKRTKLEDVCEIPVDMDDCIEHTKKQCISYKSRAAASNTKQFSEEHKGNEDTAVAMASRSKAWSKGLILAMQDPHMVILEDDKVVAIKDKYPKAKFHWLVLPQENIATINQLKREDLPLLKHILKVGKQLVEEQKKADPKIKFKCGFHAIASMSRLHMHVISQDFSSNCLKTKKHWNSFTTQYFVDAESIVSELECNGKVERKNEYKAFLDAPLRCHKCKTVQKNMPALKRHIAECDQA